jgi:hypothetical protein
LGRPTGSKGLMTFGGTFLLSLPCVKVAKIAPTIRIRISKVCLKTFDMADVPLFPFQFVALEGERINMRRLLYAILIPKVLLSFFKQQG